MTDLRPSRLKGERVRVSGLLRRVLLAETERSKAFAKVAVRSRRRRHGKQQLRRRLPLIPKSEQNRRESENSRGGRRTERSYIACRSSAELRLVVLSVAHRTLRPPHELFI